MARARQYADRVNIIKMVKVNGKWPFARIVERNGRIIRDHVWVAWPRRASPGRPLLPRMVRRRETAQKARRELRSPSCCRPRKIDRAQCRKSRTHSAYLKPRLRLCLHV